MHSIRKYARKNNYKVITHLKACLNTIRKEEEYIKRNHIEKKYTRDTRPKNRFLF